MKAIFEEYGGLILTGIIGGICIVLLNVIYSMQIETVMVPARNQIMQNEVLSTKAAPNITGENRRILVGDPVNAMEGIQANDGLGNDITAKVSAYEHVDITTKGRYPIDFEVESNTGRKAYHRIYVIVD